VAASHFYAVCQAITDTFTWQLRMPPLPFTSSAFPGKSQCLSFTSLQNGRWYNLP